MIENKLCQAERLCGKTQIDTLFASGASFITYPYRVVYKVYPSDEPLFSFFVSVPKRNFKRAVKRNRIRRRIKECYRLNKMVLHPSLSEQKWRIEAAILYLDKAETEYAVLDKKMKEMLARLLRELLPEPTSLPTPQPEDL